DGPVLVDFPVILIQNPVPKIYSYSLSSAIAEKFEAIVKLSYANSRMKDFYDILFLAERNSFEIKALKEAITETFKNRKTPLTGVEGIFCKGFTHAPENDKKWKTFVKRNSLGVTDDFREVMDKIIKFISPLFEPKSKVEKKAWNIKSFSWT
ncbi:MAG TPA: nucleotidyl transferase AbiEii/AbiGii toxin family protein, partial [Candidatus Wallbacteria bacterium]|nr:nucleotidyl transferase AbiEii/AbiGii toxin family protein [Candidatus Wallbacteria bacterium]